MPLHAPLNQFADRIIRNRELRTFIQGLMERGVTMADLLTAAKPEDKGPEDDVAIMKWYRQTLIDLNDISPTPDRTKNVLDRFRFQDEKHA